MNGVIQPTYQEIISSMEQYIDVLQIEPTDISMAEAKYLTDHIMLDNEMDKGGTIQADRYGAVYAEMIQVETLREYLIDMLGVNVINPKLSSFYGRSLKRSSSPTTTNNVTNISLKHAGVDIRAYGYNIDFQGSYSYNSIRAIADGELYIYKRYMSLPTDIIIRGFIAKHDNYRGELSADYLDKGNYTCVYLGFVIKNELDTLPVYSIPSANGVKCRGWRVKYQKGGYRYIYNIDKMYEVLKDKRMI